MDSFNKVLSFVLGLVVVIVFIIVLSNRLNIGDKLLPFKSTTPTVTKAANKKPDSKATPTVSFYPGQGQTGKVTSQPQPKGGQQAAQYQTGAIKTIPATGSPTSLLLVLNSALLLGFYLRKRTS